MPRSQVRSLPGPFTAHGCAETAWLLGQVCQEGQKCSCHAYLGAYLERLAAAARLFERNQRPRTSGVGSARLFVPWLAWAGVCSCGSESTSPVTTLASKLHQGAD